MTEFGKLIKEYRLKKGKTVKELAIELNVTPVYILDIEKGRRAAPAMEKLEKLVKFFELEDKEEIGRFYDKAAKSKERTEVPEDVRDTFEKLDALPSLLRVIKRKNLKDNNLEDIIKAIEDGKFEGDG